MENAESAIAMLRELKKMNIQLYMDDFGTGYSSLSYLHRFPVDRLKIDRSFINTMTLNRENSAIVEAIVALAHNLGKDVTAEGIETAEQLAKLRQLGCEYGQGYFFSGPVDAKEAEALLAKKTKWLQFFQTETSRQRDSVNELLTISRNNLPILNDYGRLCR